MRYSTSSTSSSEYLRQGSPQISYLDRGCRQIDTDDTGRVDKAKVLQALQSKGESYDRARETLKHVSVDASGKVELEDWVEVRTGP
jgi:plastin-1